MALSRSSQFFQVPPHHHVFPSEVRLPSIKDNDNTHYAMTQLEIRLDEPKRVYRAGEMISGLVHVTAAEEIDCRSLKVKTTCEVVTPYNNSSFVFEELALFQGTWPQGSSREYRFTISAHNWPPNFNGKIMRINHAVAAQADVLGGADAHAKHLIRIISTPPPCEAKCVSLRAVRFSKRIALLLGLLPIAVGIAIAVLLDGWQDVLEISTFLCLCGCISLVMSARNWLRTAQLGPASLKLNSTRIKAGETIEVDFYFRPRHDIFVNWLLVRLTGEEKAYRRRTKQVREYSLTERRQSSYVFLIREEKLRKIGWLRAGVAQHYNLKLKVPAHLPPTTRPSVIDGKAEICWKITTQLDADGCPDWCESIDVTAV